MSVVTTEQLDKAGLALFVHQCGQWNLVPAAAEIEWNLDPDLRAFWRGQVEIVLKALGGQSCAD